ncbi:MAG: MerR family transcriptional regulator [Caldilineaceae bacterium]
MKSAQDAPIYNLKAVVQETGIKPDTLRAWERRYGLPAPTRTESGHRLYSQNDIALLKWLLERQNEGMTISRAMELWRHVEEEASDALQLTPSKPLATPLPPIPQPLPATSDAPIIQLREAWIASCLNFDEQSAERIVTQAFGLFTVDQVCIQLLQKGLAEIGAGWYESFVTVQQEHFASALAVRRLETLLTATPPPTRPGRILIGCAPDEGHTFAPLLLSLLLRRAGWDVVFLGADIPTEDFVATTQKTKPQLVILTAQQLYTASMLHAVAEVIYQAHVPLAYGGKIFAQQPTLCETITGHYLGNEIEGAVQKIEEFMRAPHLPKQAHAPARPYVLALEAYRRRQPQIEAYVWQQSSHAGFAPDLLQKANLNFGRNIVAALSLGNVELLAIDMEWIRGLLTNHYQMPPTVVNHYLAAYLAALETHLSDDGAMLSAWLRHMLESEPTAI